MTVSDYTETMHLYWERRYGSRQPELERAAADPSAGWLTAELPILVEEMDVRPEYVREQPDAFLEQAREGFRSFVAERDLDSRAGYEQLPVHLTGMSQLRGVPCEFGSIRDDANTVTVLRNAAVSGEFAVETRVSSLTYRCPAGHEMTLSQPLFRRWTANRCGEAGCTRTVVPVDAATRARRVVEFTVDPGGTPLECAGVGKLAEDPAVRESLAGTRRLSVTGIPRLVARSDGTVTPAMELLHAEPVG